MLKFSVIVPVYNVAPYLRACLESILTAAGALDESWGVAGTCVEVVCVDDGSTDGSAMILDQCADDGVKACQCVKVIHQTNQGVSVARNAGLALARGEYICYVDADDLVEQDWLVEYQKAIDESGADLIRIGGKRGSVGETVLPRWLWQTFVLDGYPWKYALRRRIAQSACFPVGVIMTEDSLYAARVLPQIGSAFELGCEPYRHAVREGSAMFCPLPGRERLSFLNGLTEIARRDSHLDQESLSKLCAAGLLAWMSRPKDRECHREIRAVWRRLRSLGCARTDGAVPLFRFPYVLYAWIGCIGPARVWAVVVRWLVACKRRCR